MNAGTRSTRGPRSLPLAILGLGIIVTGIVTSMLWSSAQQGHADRRAALTAETASAIDFRMATYVQGLGGSRALFQASDNVTADEFHTYVTSLGVLEDLPGMQAMGWNRLVSAEDVSVYEQQMRDLHTFLPGDYAVRPTDGLGSDLLVVEFVEPLAGNEAALGFNILSEERRAAAFQRARATGAAAATVPVDLVQDDEPVPGILVLLPTTQDGDIEGAVVAVFRTRDLLAAAEQDLGHSIIVQDIGAVGSAEREPVLLSAPGTPIDTAAQAEIAVYGRRWLVSLADDSSGAPSPLGLILGAASGVALALALAWVVRSTQHAAQTADDKAALLTAELLETNHELAVVGTRLEEGIRSADILVWESNLTTGRRWSSADLDHPEAGIEDEFMQRLHPDDLERFDATDDPAPGESREHQFRLADKHGTYRWILSRSHGVERNGDQVVIGAHIDVTDQHMRTELVERLNDDLTERNQALRDFTHVASHDLRSPLRAVNSLVGFLREDLPADLAEDAQHHLTRIDERVERMSQLIDDLLVYASAHDREGRTEMVDVADVVDDVLGTIEIPDDIVTVVDCDIPAVAITRTPFSMCVRNLVDNALKHHDKPGGQVAITAHIDDGHLHLAVTDDGPGISPEYLPKIFEPFRRLRADEATPGSGIGLSVIERATAAHGARIDVHSVVGEGSRFTIRWPIDREPAAPAIDLVQEPALS